MGSVAAAFAAVFTWMAAMMGLETAAVRQRRERFQALKVRAARASFIAHYEFPPGLIHVARTFADQQCADNSDGNVEEVTSSFVEGLRQFLHEVDPTNLQIPSDPTVDALFRFFMGEERAAYLAFCDEAYGYLVEYPKEKKVAFKPTDRESGTRALNKAGWSSNPFPTPKVNRNARAISPED